MVEIPERPLSLFSSLANVVLGAFGGLVCSKALLDLVFTGHIVFPMTRRAGGEPMPLMTFGEPNETIVVAVVTVIVGLVALWLLKIGLIGLWRNFRS
jgi:hypothetical protein